MNISSNVSSDHSFMICGYFYTAGTFIYVSLLPVFIFVIWVVFQQWWKPPRSSASAHSDVFTFNMAALEVCGVVGLCVLTLIFHLLHTWEANASLTGAAIIFMAQCGQMSSHCLVCLERYLAVVHPIIYLRLKKNGEVIRNVCIVLVWLFSSDMAFLYHLGNAYFNLFSMLTFAMLSLVLITFFCASVLYALIRPGPGERGGDRKRIDQSKRRAFCTMTAIMAALLLKFAILFASYMVVLYQRQTINDFKQCLLSVSTQGLNLPSSLVLPLLFLYRHRKLRQLQVNREQHYMSR